MQDSLIYKNKGKHFKLLEQKRFNEKNIGIVECVEDKNFLFVFDYKIDYSLESYKAEYISWQHEFKADTYSSAKVYYEAH